MVRWWPELGAAGKGGIVVAHLLAHQAGLATVPGPVAGLLDHDGTATALAAAPPDWVPGQAHGEHALTYGNLLGELVRRVDGRSLGRFVADELAGPLGLDIHVGVPAADLARVVDIVGATPAWWAERRGEPGSLRWAALGAGVDGELINSTAWRTGEVPAVNGHATARALAAFYVAVLDGRIPATVAQPAMSGPDLVLGTDVTWTLGSLQVDDVELGMGGAGGNYAGARPALGLAWAFLTTRMGRSSGPRSWSGPCSRRSLGGDRRQHVEAPARRAGRRPASTPATAAGDEHDGQLADRARRTCRAAVAARRP